MKRKPEYKRKRDKKVNGKKKVEHVVAEKGHWRIMQGKIISQGNVARNNKSLFKLFAEKIPSEFLVDVKEQVISDHGAYGKVEGIYVVHDSMTYPRYIGRGDVFARISACIKKHPDELKYFSLYLVDSKKHEREIETLLLHVTGTLLQFNERKKRLGTNPGSILDFERGTSFLERQRKRGKRKKTKNT